MVLMVGYYSRDSDLKANSEKQKALMDFHTIHHRNNVSMLYIINVSKK